MSEMQEFEVFSNDANAVVARHLGRNSPGLLIQGDTLKTLLENIEELHQEAAAENLEAVKDISEIVRERVLELLIHYEEVLEAHGWDTPYAGSVRP